MKMAFSNDQLKRLSTLVANVTGLHFPPARWPDLQRAIAQAAGELGIDDASSYAKALLSAPLSQGQLDVLAAHLTVGETYFYRDIACFESLSTKILPTLIENQDNRGRRLRIWSTACCTGEEAYSVAIALHRAIPDLARWNVSITATDLNPRFLQKANTGLFGEWSFRNAPSWLKERYFRPAAKEKFEILPHIRKMVRFARLNLVDEVYPSTVNDIHSMDLIFCRNVLMYFSQAQAIAVLRRLHQAQSDSGWLVVGASDLPPGISNPYARVNFHDAIVYRKDRQLTAPANALVQDWDNSWHGTPGQGRIVSLIEPQKSFTEPTRDLPVESPAEQQELFSPPSDHFSTEARALANQGKLKDALLCCDRWLHSDKMNPTAHYLRAVILEEQGAIDEAYRGLRAVIYLNPGFALAHLGLGRIAWARGNRSAEKHLRNALTSLNRLRPNDIVPDSEGASVRSLIEMVNSLMTECEVENR